MKKMKHLKYILILSIGLLSASCSTPKKLYGTWLMDPSPSENVKIKLIIQKKNYTFYVNDKETVSRSYSFKGNTIISEEIPIVNKRDSIQVINIKNDTLTLHLKEMGMYKERTFIRLE